MNNFKSIFNEIHETIFLTIVQFVHERLYYCVVFVKRKLKLYDCVLYNCCILLYITMPCLCYAYTRIQSIMRKVNAPEIAEIQKWVKNVDVSLKHQEERKLAKKVLQWYDKVNQVEQDLYMHVLCDWVYDLACSFTKFYDNCYVLEKNQKTGEEKLNKDRLILVALTSMIMQKAFKVLGFLPTSRM